MYVRRCYRKKNGKRHGYWALVESYRTARGPRQRVVAYLGEVDEHGRMALPPADGTYAYQQQLYEARDPQWVEVDLAQVRVERTREFGGPWLGYTLLQRLDLPRFLETTLPPGRVNIPWPAMALVLVLGRLCTPSSELHLAEHFSEGSARPDLLGVPAAKVNDDRLYRALDQLLPHKAALEQHLKGRRGQLFAVHYDLLLYDVTSTYFEGEAARNPQAQRGYSRDHRPDCKQVNLALVVTREGLPLGYEDLWTAYIHLTDAELAFRIQKSDLELRPIWHQKETRVQAHIFVCFLAYVLWKTLARWCQAAGLGDEPRKIFAELSQIRLVDVVLPTRNGLELRKRCVSRPTEHQAILLQRLGLSLPTHLEAVGL